LRAGKYRVWTNPIHTTPPAFRPHISAAYWLPRAECPLKRRNLVARIGGQSRWSGKCDRALRALVQIGDWTAATAALKISTIKPNAINVVWVDRAPTFMEDNMKHYAGALAAAALCTSVAMAASEESNPVDFMAFHQVEIVFHTAASTKDLDLMMSLFADDANLSVGGKSYVGKDQVRGYFATVAGSFQPQNVWVAYTPAQRIRFEVNGDRAHLYFECLYVDAKAKEIKAHTFSEDNLVRSGGKWLIREMKAGAVPEL
jgi:hypothetical protein